MKRSLRIPVALIFLVAVAASLTCRTAVRRCLLSKQTTLAEPLLLPRWNSTLLRFAADDPGEADWNAEISSLLRGDFPERSLSIWRRLSASSPRGKSPATSSPRIRRPDEYRVLFPAFHRSLLTWSRRRRQLDPFTMSSLPGNLFGLPPGRRYPSCAVVGNSGVLLNQTHGRLIDSHDLVIRLNNARIAGFSALVGAKTNISFVNSNILHFCHLRRSCACNPYGEQTPIVAYICQPLHFLDLAACNATAVTPKILVTDAAFDLLCARVVKYYSARRLGVEKWGRTFDGKEFHYSSGMQAVMAAVGACDRVGVFGFGKREGARHHYHTNQKEELWLHDYQAEYELYRDLAQRPAEVPFLADQRGFEVPPVVVYW